MANGTETKVTIDLTLTKTTSDQSAYTSALMAAIAADGVIDDAELLQMYELFALLGTNPEERCRLVEALWMDPKEFASASIAPELTLDPDLSVALAKDLMLIQSTSRTEKARKVAENLRRQFALRTDQINVLKQFVAVENKILRSLGAPGNWIVDENDHREWVSRAAAVGIPLAALNIAGIGGFSAVGITSGLASLGGMSGLVVLGLNPMTAGIGALILAGVTVKKIADFALSTAGEDAENDAALEQITSLRVKSASYIAEDRAVVGTPRTREVLAPARRERRAELSAALTRVLEDARST